MPQIHALLPRPAPLSYGTRSVTVVAQLRSGRIFFAMTSFDGDGSSTAAEQANAPAPLQKCHVGGVDWSVAWVDVSRTTGGAH